MKTSPEPTVSMMELRSQPGTIVDKVFNNRASFVLERFGEPRAALVPLQAYNEMELRRQLAKDRLFEMIDTIRERNKEVDPEIIQAAIDEAVEEVRKENKNK